MKALQIFSPFTLEHPPQAATPSRLFQRPLAADSACGALVHAPRPASRLKRIAWAPWHHPKRLVTAAGTRRHLRLGCAQPRRRRPCCRGQPRLHARWWRGSAGPSFAETDARTAPIHIITAQRCQGHLRTSAAPLARLLWGQPPRLAAGSQPQPPARLFGWDLIKRRAGTGASCGCISRNASKWAGYAAIRLQAPAKSLNLAGDRNQPGHQHRVASKASVHHAGGAGPRAGVRAARSCRPPTKWPEPPLGSVYPPRPWGPPPMTVATLAHEHAPKVWINFGHGQI